MILAANALKMVSLAKVLSSCIDASQQGCEIIRDYQRAGNIQGDLKQADEIKSVVTKADVDAQTKIVGNLRQIWGDDLKIVGEEDDDAAPFTSTDGNVPNLDHLESILDGSYDESVPLEELCIFVDPLDGTREFVEGRLQNVACLIGIMRNQRSIAGVIGLPFPEGNPEADVVTYYAFTDAKKSSGRVPPLLTGTSETAQPKSSTNSVILTGDSKNPILRNATRYATELAADSGVEHQIVGGTAAKLVKVATGDGFLAILHFVTEQWDTCAPEALLKAQGGMITDLFGAPLSYSATRKFGNVFGVVASSGGDMAKIHTQLCEKMRSDKESVKAIYGDYTGVFSKTLSSDDGAAQAIDVAYDLDGIPLHRKDLEEQILGGLKKSEGSLHGYSVPESGAWRGLMSTGCRVLLDWGEDSADLPESVFYKRIVMSNLDHARKKLIISPHKVTRDVRSYQVESGFLTSAACQEGLIAKAGLRINKVFGSTLRPIEGPTPKEQLESRFSLLLEDFSQADGWNQQWLLDEPAARAMLDTLASMHAFFWTGSDVWRDDGGMAGKDLEDIVWPNGSYTQPKLQGLDQLSKIEEGWKRRLPDFEAACKDIKELEGVNLKSIGTRLQSIADVAGHQAHPFFDDDDMSKDMKTYRTLIHGDPKQANIFFRGDNENLEVGLIDFQWSGFGLAASDLAHFISAAVHPSHLSYDGKKEAELIDYYYEKLVAKLVKNGVAKSIEEVHDTIFPRATLQHQYEIALLDMCRLVFAYAWQRWKPETEPTQASLNRNSYNKSLDSALWLITNCSKLLSKHEEKLAQQKVVAEAKLNK